MRSASALEQRKDIGGAEEKMKIALAVDPDNDVVRDKLSRLADRCGPAAEKHFRAGMALRDTNPAAARSEFLEALRMRPDYMQAVTALRNLQLASSEDAVQKRLQREAKRTAARSVKKKEPDEEEDAYIEDYSLDEAVSSYEDGDYVKAARGFEKIQERFPNDPDIRMYLDSSWYNVGKAYFAKKEYRKALATFAKVRKGFQQVDEYIVKCRQCLKSSEPARR